VRSPVVALKEGVGRRNERFDGREQLAMGHLAPEVAPEHLDGVQPGAVGWQVEQHQSTSRSTQDRLDLVVLMGVGVVPGHVDSACRMLLQQCFQQLGDLTPAFAATNENNRLPGMVVDRSDAVALFGLSGRLDHYLLAHRAPHSLEGGHPT
jgi:hypothetical protein